MQAIPSNRSATRSYTKKPIIVALVLITLLVAALVVTNIYRASQPASLPRGTRVISQRVLEEQYGLRVSLVAITGAGGFVDVRLKMVDGDKAKLLLADAKHFPLLFANGAILNAPQDTMSQTIEFISGGNLFVMYPNAGNAVTRGSPVTIIFGNTALEPINAK